MLRTTHYALRTSHYALRTTQKKKRLIEKLDIKLLAKLVEGSKKNKQQKNKNKIFVSDLRRSWHGTKAYQMACKEEALLHTEG